MYNGLILSYMEVRIENMIFGWHEKLPEMFIELLNTLVLTKSEQDVERNFSMPFSHSGMAHTIYG